MLFLRKRKGYIKRDFIIVIDFIIIIMIIIYSIFYYNCLKYLCLVLLVYSVFLSIVINKIKKLLFYFYLFKVVIFI